VVSIIYKFGSVCKNKKIQFSGPGPGAEQPDTGWTHARFEIPIEAHLQCPRIGETGRADGAARTGLIPASLHQRVGLPLAHLSPPAINATSYDVDINTSDTSTPTHNQISGPITRARARQLNNQVSSLLASCSSYLDNGNVYSVLLLRNDGQERNGVAFTSATFGFQNSSSF
jgi:hypothetical protein